MNALTRPGLAAPALSALLGVALLASAAIAATGSCRPTRRHG